MSLLLVQMTPVASREFRKLLHYQALLQAPMKTHKFRSRISRSPASVCMCSSSLRQGETSESKCKLCKRTNIRKRIQFSDVDERPHKNVESHAAGEMPRKLHAADEMPRELVVDDEMPQRIVEGPPEMPHRIVEGPPEEEEEPLPLVSEMMEEEESAWYDDDDDEPTPSAKRSKLSSDTEDEDEDEEPPTPAMKRIKLSPPTEEERGEEDSDEEEDDETPTYEGTFRTKQEMNVIKRRPNDANDAGQTSADAGSRFVPDMTSSSTVELMRKSLFTFGDVSTTDQRVVGKFRSTSRSIVF